MSKLLKLKQWLTIQETTKHLSSGLGEAVAESDIFQFALLGRLRLSIIFRNYITVKEGCIKSVQEAEKTEIPNPGGAGAQSIVRGVRVSDTDVIQFSDNIRYLSSGLWDVPILAGNITIIEEEYYRAIGEAEEEVVTFDGALVLDSLGEKYFQPQNEIYSFKELCDKMGYKEADKRHGDPLNYRSADVFPENSFFVVRTEAIQQFLAAISEQEKPYVKPLLTRERDTLLAIIATLAKDAKIPVSTPSAAAKTIATIAEEMGVCISQRAIEGHLKKIPDVLEKKSN